MSDDLSMTQADLALILQALRHYERELRKALEGGETELRAEAARVVTLIKSFEDELANPTLGV